MKQSAVASTVVWVVVFIHFLWILDPDGLGEDDLLCRRINSWNLKNALQKGKTFTNHQQFVGSMLIFGGVV